LIGRPLPISQYDGLVGRTKAEMVKAVRRTG